MRYNILVALLAIAITAGSMYLFFDYFGFSFISCCALAGIKIGRQAIIKLSKLEQKLQNGKQEQNNKKHFF